MSKERAINIAILFLSIAFGMLIVEFAFRMVLGHTIVLFPRNHAAARYGEYTLRTMTPNSVFWHQSIDGQWRFKTNNKGFRDNRDYSYDKPASTLRVLVLGDSNTAGFEVDQDRTYASVLESRLRQKGVRAEVMNTGVSGLGTAEQLAYLENEGVKYSPDAVVLGFSANDYLDNVRANLFELADGKVVTASRHYAPAVDVIRLTTAIPGLKWLGENSYAYSYLFNAMWDLFKARSMQRATTAEPAQTATVERPDLEYVGPTGEATPAQDALTVGLIKRMGQLGRENGILTILVDIPVPGPGNGVKTAFTTAVREAAAAHFDYVLASDEILGAKPSSQAAHVPHGHRHINEYTHQRIAEALLQALVSRPVAGKLKR